MISVVFGLIFGQTENIFSLTEFTMPTKHVIFRKMISEFHFQPKQMEPKFFYAKVNKKIKAEQEEINPSLFHSSTSTKQWYPILSLIFLLQ